MNAIACYYEFSDRKYFTEIYSIILIRIATHYSPDMSVHLLSPVYDMCKPIPVDMTASQENRGLDKTKSLVGLHRCAAISEHWGIVYVRRSLILLCSLYATSRHQLFFGAQQLN